MPIIVFKCFKSIYYIVTIIVYLIWLLCVTITGPKPGPPRNVSITEVRNGFVISWQAPLERAHLVRYYVIHYKTDGIWRTLNKAQIRAEDTSYLGTDKSCLQIIETVIRYKCSKKNHDGRTMDHVRDHPGHVYHRSNI